MGRLKKDGSEDQRFKGASERDAERSHRSALEMQRFKEQLQEWCAMGCAGIIILAILALVLALAVSAVGYRFNLVYEEFGTTGVIVALVGSALFLSFWFRWRKSVRAKAKRSQEQEVTSVNKSEGEG